MEWSIPETSHPIAARGGRAARPGRSHRTGGGRRARRRGIALAWTAVVLFSMLLMVGLSIDWGKITLNVQELQNAADAAALAGAQWAKIDVDVARSRAWLLGQSNDTEKQPVELNLNPGNAADGDIILGQYDTSLLTFTPTLDTPNAVQVYARRTVAQHGPLGMLFGPLAGVPTADRERRATAYCTGVPAPGLIVLADSPAEYPPNIHVALDIGGTGTLNIDPGSVVVNTTQDSVTFHGTPEVHMDGLYTHAKNDPKGSDIAFSGIAESDLDLEGIFPGVKPMPDPLAALPAPSYLSSPWTDHVISTGLYTPTDGEVLQPGYYAEGIKITNGTVTFSPGIYGLGGTQDNKPGLAFEGGTLIAHGVMFYIAGGQLQFNGNGSVDMTPPGASGVAESDYPAWQTGFVHTYDNVTIFQARDNLAKATINGTSDYNIGGILYFPENHLTLEGNSENPFRPGDQLIAHTANLGGTGTIEINYHGPEVILGYMSVLVHVVN